MRTRILNKMTNAEVEAYLERNDIIFVPAGTVETHGLFPVDVETTIPEATAVLLAEKADGLALIDLPYFFCGATTEARGSVQVSISAGYEYLMELAHSLLRQGFKRQVWLSAHGPSFVTGSAVINDFFNQTGVSICFFDGMRLRPAQNSPATQRAPIVGGMNLRTLGAYRVLGRLDEIVVDPELPVERAFGSSVPVDDETQDYNYVFKFGPLSGQVGFYQNRPECHGGFYGAVRSAEELDRLSKEGEAIMRAGLDNFDAARYFAELKDLNEQTEKQMKMYPHLPSAAVRSEGRN